MLDREKLLVTIALDHAVQYVPGNEPGVYSVGQAGDNLIQVDPKSVFGDGTMVLNRGLAEMTIADLREQWTRKVNVLHESPHAEIIYIHQKFSFPVACLVFAVLAVSLGFHTRKEGKLAGLALGLAVIFLYYALMAIAEAGAKSATHWFSPHWARWFPNLVLGVLGIVAAWWRARATGQSLSVSVPARLAAFLTRQVSTPVAPATSAPAQRRVVVVIRVPRLSLPRPRLLDLYVGRQYIRMVALGFVGLIILYYIGTIVDMSEKLFKGQASGWLLAQYLWYSTPRFSYYVIPIATLVGTLGTIGALTRSSELTVMRACGVSLYRVAMPLLLLALCSGGMLFALEEHVLAESNKRADELEDTIRGRPHHTVNLSNRNWLVGENDQIYYYTGFDAERAEIHNLTVFETAVRPYRLLRQTYAGVAVCPDRTCRDGKWQAQDGGWIQDFPSAGHAVRTSFDRRKLVLKPVRDFTLAQVDTSMMTFQELRDYITRSKASGFGIADEEVDLHSKIAFPAVTLVMTMLAVPFAVTTGRRGALYGIGLAIILSVAYWLLMAFFLAAGKAGLLPAPLAAWATNTLFAAVAVYLVLTVRT
jgi:LPS export ABC transporter permease LptG